MMNPVHILFLLCLEIVYFIQVLLLDKAQFLHHFCLHVLIM